MRTVIGQRNLELWILRLIGQVLSESGFASMAALKPILPMVEG
jgi:hypothetical protein